MKELKELIKQREQLCYALIEAEESEVNELNQELDDIEQRIEYLKTIKGDKSET